MNRKDEHVSLAKAFHKPHHNDFDEVRIVHQSFTLNRFSDVSIRTELFQREFSSPFFINAMTGGSEWTKKINQQLAIVARETDLMMATGSVSTALKTPETKDSFSIVRKEFPDGFLLANIGAGSSLKSAQQAVHLFQADALQIHLNTPQELVMPEGDRDFADWLFLLEEIVAQIEVPVIVKEVGFGMSRETINQILATGVKTIDIAGSGGTSFTQIENARRKKREFNYLDQFGQTTVESLLEANEISQEFNLIASGGIRNAFDIFKSLCFGAKMVGISATILNYLLTNGCQATIELVERWKNELQTLYTMSGALKTSDLTSVPLILSGNPKNWCQARNIDIKKYSMRKPT
ncbi:type 2 isopentenyl-diphosphate Delta-isomerase [Tetragenococcus halophilus]|uniref:type 2 isopentenyl-diphosphate Delta-isomerase n=1 Tax=Tetragenococcus halophilus TaxID=51669 RepID=UPI00209BA5DF|nr:type 2 isopentenyl-diphosphate Delta-isomerase [Tetragenococcus halophilus]MCO8290548.1 type 2 isopentenyl-diphosphate Delta-isomerase [Tetragenococcus halophilus]MCO8295741.1 type 2 isopentenyl-diphosphate Delta-isomerase [Tetragenococcus halophilus]